MSNYKCLVISSEEGAIFQASIDREGNIFFEVSSYAIKPDGEAYVSFKKEDAVALRNQLSYLLKMV